MRVSMFKCRGYSKFALALTAVLTHTFFLQTGVREAIAAEDCYNWSAWVPPPTPCTCVNTAGGCPNVTDTTYASMCYAAQAGVNGETQCITAFRVVGNIVNCDTNADVVALLLYAAAFVGCMAACASVPPSGGAALVGCLACIAGISIAPAAACAFVNCSRGGVLGTISATVPVGTGGDPCVGQNT